MISGRLNVSLFADAGNMGDSPDEAEPFTREVDKGQTEKKGGEKRGHSPFLVSLGALSH